MIKKNGFTLIEVVVVASITGFITTFLLVNFNRTRVNITESVQTFTSKVNIARTRANSSALYNGDIRCGYGVLYLSPQSFAVYAGESVDAIDCEAANKNYNPGGTADYDTILETVTLPDQRVEFKSNFGVIYFEPPDPTTTIIDSGGVVHTNLDYVHEITIGRVGTLCPTDCKTIDVTGTGRIEIE